MNRTPASSGGFSMLEVLVAVAVLGMALTPLLGACLGMQESLERCRDIDAAAALATAKLTEVERVGGRNWQSRRGDFGPLQPLWQWQVDCVKGLPGNMTLATVTVWSSSKAQSSFTIEKLLVR